MRFADWLSLAIRGYTQDDVEGFLDEIEARGRGEMTERQKRDLVADAEALAGRTDAGGGLMFGARIFPQIKVGGQMYDLAMVERIQLRSDPGCFGALEITVLDALPSYMRVLEVDPRKERIEIYLEIEGYDQPLGPFLLSQEGVEKLPAAGPNEFARERWTLAGPLIDRDRASGRRPLEQTLVRPVIRED